MSTFLSRHFSLILLAANSIALMIQPIPFCFDCEASNPYGHTSSYETRGDVLFYTLAIVIFFVGLMRFRHGLIVPFGTVLALIVTQPLGGVPLWSLRYNEGPIILIFVLPATVLLFTVGLMFSFAKDKIFEKAQTSPQLTSHPTRPTHPAPDQPLP